MTKVFKYWHYFKINKNKFGYDNDSSFYIMNVEKLFIRYFVLKVS